MKKHIVSGLLVIIFVFTGISNLQAQTASHRKSIFLTENEKVRLQEMNLSSPAASLLSAMQIRVEKRATLMSFSNPGTTNQWWHFAGEYLTDAAFIHAVRPSEKVDAWLRASVMSLIRRPMADWAGPAFRNYNGGVMVGALETAHLAWGIAIAYDLASDLFTQAEKDEITTALREKGLLPCRRYLERTSGHTNWNCVLFAGFTVTAAVLGEEEELAYALEWLPVAKDHFQKDGSYGESLQYSNYAAISTMLAHEALIRYYPEMEPTLEPYARMVEWASYALFYQKPLSGWPIMDWPRSANFGDAAAIFRPSGDLLVHIAARGKKELPQYAGLASWLFNTLYLPANEPGPHDLASFGFVNDFGFLSVIMLADAAPALSPAELDLPVVKAFSGGDVLARSSWDGETTLAARIPSEPRHASAHLHGDINSFILVHNNERLLLDPGHSCYRSIIHGFEISSETHNTCTFQVPGKARTLVQHGGKRRRLTHKNGKLQSDDPAADGGRRLIASHEGSISVIGSDAAEFYGEPIRNFKRFWIMCGSNAMFIVDQIKSDVPVKTTWNWLLNNRDGQLDYKIERPNKLTSIRGNAAVKITHFAEGNYTGPVYAVVHDAYHPLPAQRGEGAPGSGMLMKWTESASSTDRMIVHTFAIDNPAAVNSWEGKAESNTYTLESKDRDQKWSLHLNDDGSFKIEDVNSGKTYQVNSTQEGIWSLSSL